MTAPYDHFEQVRTDGSAFVDTIRRADHSLSVHSCPGWNLGDLAWHVGEVWNFWGAIVARRIDDVGDLRSIERPARAHGDALVEVIHAAHVHLCDALDEAPEDTPVWTWTGANRDVAWVQRRMAHETAVHHWDAATTTGDPFVMPTALAADGIDEFLTWFAAAERAEGAMKVGGTVHLHCTDTGTDVNGDWYVAAMKEPIATFTRERRGADATISATAQDLLLWLWRRTAGPVEVTGNDVVARRFRAFTDLT